MSYFGTSGSAFGKCVHAAGAGLCISCMLGVSAFYGTQPPRLERIPSPTVQVKAYQLPGGMPGSDPDGGHFEVSTGTSTSATTGTAWGHALLPPELEYATMTDPSSGHVLKGDDATLYVAKIWRSS